VQDYKTIIFTELISSMTFIYDSTLLVCAFKNGEHFITLSTHIRTMNHFSFDEDQD
ncbi:unnamed protein product, partial [Rotaria sp. Silwood1]